MTDVATWFEIPVTDMPRAKQFYTNIMQTSFEDDEMKMPDGSPFLMAVFNHQQGSVSGMLVKGTEYQPSATGAVIYLNGGKELNTILERVKEQNGKVIVPKMPIEDGAKGWFAQFLDSEGNRVGLYSPPM